MSGHCLTCGSGLILPVDLEYCTLTLQCRTLALAASLRAKGLAPCENSHVCTVLKKAKLPVTQYRTHYVAGTVGGHETAYKRSWGPAAAVRIVGVAMHPAVRRRLLEEIRTSPAAMREYATFSIEELIGVRTAIAKALTPEERLPGSTAARSAAAMVVTP